MLKTNNYRNEDYLKFVRNQDCVVDGNNINTVSHHVRINQNGGMGLKPSDYRVIPLNWKRHSELHTIGEKSFYKKYGIDENLIITCYLCKYILQQLKPSREVIEDLEKIIENSKTRL